MFVVKSIDSGGSMGSMGHLPCFQPPKRLQMARLRRPKAPSAPKAPKADAGPEAVGGRRLKKKRWGMKYQPQRKYIYDYTYMCMYVCIYIYKYPSSSCESDYCWGIIMAG